MLEIGICTQIKNRLYQFKDTFYENIDTISKYDNINWTIVDIHSNDGIDNFLQNFLSSYQNNHIHYYKLIDTIDYSIPIAKNFSLRLSSNYDFLFNLDADNYIDNAIDNIIGLDNNFFGIKCSTKKVGVYGRLGIHSHALKIVGGYDETFLPAAGHENDLMSRLNLIGYNLKDYTCHKLPIQNSKYDTIKHTNHNNLTWQEMNKINFYKRKNNSYNKIINPNVKFTRASFIHNFKNKIELSNNY
jgi:hypothetical protein